MKVLQNGIFLIVVSAIIVAVWFYNHLQIALHSDFIFLSVSAQRMIAGEMMSQAYYDTNPPLSMIIYIIPAWISGYFNIPLHYPLGLYSLALVLISCFLLNAIIVKIRLLPDLDRRLFMSAYLMVNTLCMNLFFGSKDHYLILALAPFCLLQYAITHKYEIPRHIQHTVLALGSFFIMLKPYYYIVPAFMLLHRMIINRRLFVLFDRDSLYLAVAAILYAVIIYVFFWDFITVVIPEIFSLYLNIKYEGMFFSTILYADFTMLVISLSLLIRKDPPKLLLFFCAIGFLCLLGFNIQSKGFFYHLTPWLVCFASALSLFLYYLISKTISFLRIKEKASPLIALGIIVLYSGVFFKYFVIPNMYISHEEYKKTQLVKLVSENVPEGGAYFMFDWFSDIPQQLHIYTGRKNASRFPFFMYFAVMELMPNVVTEDERKIITEKYTRMIAEDIERHDPKMLLIARIDYNGDGQLYDIWGNLLKYKHEYNDLSSYEFWKTVEINEIDYRPATKPKDKKNVIDIYMRDF